jgi:hypothetical protein
LTFGTFARVPGSGQGNWVLSQATVDRAGTVIAPGDQLDFGYMAPRCPGLISTPRTLPSQGKIATCVHKLGIHQTLTYQPGTRFRAFQGIESAIFLALTAALVAVTVWAVRRRIA